MSDEGGYPRTVGGFHKVCPRCGTTMARHRVDVSKLGQLPGTEFIDGDWDCPRCGKTLIEFLREQLDADERVALAANPGPWTIDPEDFGLPDPNDVPVLDASGEAICQSPDDGVRGGHSQATAEHIAAWDPVRVLAEVKAKRAILDAHDRPQHHCPIPVIQSTVGQLWDLDEEEAAPACWTVILLAQPYAGRDGWQPEWSVAE